MHGDSRDVSEKATLPDVVLHVMETPEDTAVPDVILPMVPGVARLPENGTAVPKEAKVVDAIDAEITLLMVTVLSVSVVIIGCCLVITVAMTRPE